MPIDSTQSRGVFEQLQEECQSAVHVVIENHDAWVHSDEIQLQVDAAARERLARAPRMAAVAERIQRQRDALAAIAIRLPMSAKSAG